jgi:hypothetical protein
MPRTPARIQAVRRGIVRPVLLAAVTLQQVVWMLILIVVVHAVLLTPAIVAIIGAWSERVQNREHRPQV